MYAHCTCTKGTARGSLPGCSRPGNRLEKGAGAGLGIERGAKGIGKGGAHLGSGLGGHPEGGEFGNSSAAREPEHLLRADREQAAGDVSTAAGAEDASCHGGEEGLGLREVGAAGGAGGDLQLVAGDGEQVEFEVAGGCRRGSAPP